MVISATSSDDDDSDEDEPSKRKKKSPPSVSWSRWIEQWGMPSKAPFTLIPAWINNYIYYEVWGEIT